MTISRASAYATHQEAPTTNGISQSQQVIPTTSVNPQPQSGSQLPALQANDVSSTLQLQDTVAPQTNVLSNALNLQGAVKTLPLVHRQLLEETKVNNSGPPSVVIQRKFCHQEQASTTTVSAETTQANPQAQHQLHTSTSHEDATEQKKCTGEPKPITMAQLKVESHKNCTIPTSSAVDCKVTSSQPSTTQALISASAKASPLRKTTTAVQSVQEALSKTQNPATSQVKSNAITQQTGQPQVKPLSQPNIAVTTVPKTQNKNAAPQQNGDNNQQPQKAVLPECKGNSPTVQAAAKNMKIKEEEELTKQTGKETNANAVSVEKSPLASQTITKDDSKVGSERKKEIKHKKSTGRRVLKPRRRLAFQEKEDDNVGASASSPTRKPSGPCSTKKTPEKLEIVKPEDIDAAIDIALDKVPYTPTRTVKIMPQIPPPQIDDEDEDVAESHNEQIICTPLKRRPKGGKGRYKNSNYRKSVNCCCEESCHNCTSAEDWDSTMAVHNRRKR